MYAVIQKELFEKKVVDIVTDLETYKFTKNVVKDSAITFVNDLTLLDLRTNDLYLPGKYLLKNKNIFVYLEKIVEISQGYIYNSKCSYINVICEWELIQINKNCKLPIMSKDKNVIWEWEVVPELVPIDETCELPTMSKDTNTKEIADNKSSNESKQQFKEFTFNKDVYSSNCIIGKRGCGKTKLFENILDKYDEEFINNSIIFYRDRFYANYSKNYSGAKLYDKYKPEILDEFIEKAKKNGQINGAVIFEDSLSSKGEWINHP